MLDPSVREIGNKCTFNFFLSQSFKKLDQLYRKKVAKL